MMEILQEILPLGPQKFARAVMEAHGRALDRDGPRNFIGVGRTPAGTTGSPRTPVSHPLKRQGLFPLGVLSLEVSGGEIGDGHKRA